MTCIKKTNRQNTTNLIKPIKCESDPPSEGSKPISGLCVNGQYNL